MLDVGCGAGRLGEALKARQSCAVFGIEAVEEAAHAAKTRLDDVLVGDVERMASPFAPATFDAIVCGDVLEHLREPETFLRQARSWLRPQGSLIASIPNVRHHSVVRGLLAGNWTYEAAGLLDRTHLRFFTRRSIETLFEGAGFRIDPGGGFEDENAVRRRAHLLSGEDRMRRRPRARASGFIRFFVKPGDLEQRRALLDHYQQAP